jgi:hypothetical protein
MRRIIAVVVSLAFLGGGFYVLRDAFGCMAGTRQGECHVFFGIAVNGGFMVAIGGWLLWNEFVGRPRSSERR